MQISSCARVVVDQRFVRERSNEFNLTEKTLFWLQAKDSIAEKLLLRGIFAFAAFNMTGQMIRFIF